MVVDSTVRYRLSTDFFAGVRVLELESYLCGSLRNLCVLCVELRLNEEICRDLHTPLRLPSLACPSIPSCVHREVGGIDEESF